MKSTFEKAIDTIFIFVMVICVAWLAIQLWPRQETKPELYIIEVTEPPRLLGEHPLYGQWELYYAIEGKPYMIRVFTEQAFEEYCAYLESKFTIIHQGSITADYPPDPRDLAAKRK